MDQKITKVWTASIKKWITRLILFIFKFYIRLNDNYGKPGIKHPKQQADVRNSITASIKKAFEPNQGSTLRQGVNQKAYNLLQEDKSSEEEHGILESNI